ncbi:type II toxin-antitoxin system RelE/ParE family toxin [Rhizobium pusense]|uniref:Type II toxin-antitoxin system RelE/ParE family toxin n=2 Tax=Agrobacterium pusense TaxID=648995 RepID=A0A6H0ZU96_9HYPH|nr:type II toxin-antitoxin system RelE/ParE family toxin [Agrobacterium pusense]MDH2092655.1 type II toxin-antitoxin system RelE/ParE family toxin [Agrobacterium pusense]QIX23677.1 type II toxin-antitoxin system RelE/ParE family toxin [Agrobacterium pusense]
MQTVSELNSFRRSAVAAGMTDEEVSSLVTYLANHPDAGDEIKGTGGCRKLRYAISSNNKGKSGGVRVITFFTGENMPVFLIAAFAKSVKVSLTKAERNKLKTVTDEIVKEYSTRVTRLKVGATA